MEYAAYNDRVTAAKCQPCSRTTLSTMFPTVHSCHVPCTVSDTTVNLDKSRARTVQAEVGRDDFECYYEVACRRSRPCFLSAKCTKPIELRGPNMIATAYGGNLLANNCPNVESSYMRPGNSVSISVMLNKPSVAANC